MPRAWLGMTLNRQRVCPFTFTSTMQLPIALKKKKKFFFSSPFSACIKF